MVLVHAAHGLVLAVWIASDPFASVDVQLEEFTGACFVGAPDVATQPLLMFSASMGGSGQISSITALLLLLPSIVFTLVVERFSGPTWWRWSAGRPTSSARPGRRSRKREHL